MLKSLLTRIEWIIFGGPKDIYELVAQQDRVQERLQAKYYSEMTKEQEDFREIIEGLDSTIGSFYQNSNAKAHAEMNDKVIQIMEKLEETITNSRKYNSREDLFGRELTDYSKIQQLLKDFTPFSNLWKITYIN